MLPPYLKNVDENVGLVSEYGGPLWVKTRKTKMRGLPLPREDLKNTRIEDLKNLRIKEHRTEDRGFQPKCEDQAAKIAIN